MALYSQNIKNLVSGVSQQAPILRLPEQLEAQHNGLSSESAGLQKRPPTTFVKSLMPALADNVEPLIHFVDRDASTKYFIYFYKNLLYVMDVKGNKYTVDYQQDPGYLQAANPQASIRAITIADHTFITNKTVVTRMSGVYSPDTFAAQGALVHVKQGQYGRQYAIWVEEWCIASHRTPDGGEPEHSEEIDTCAIALELAYQIRNKGLTAECRDGWINIRGVNSIKTQDGFNDNAMVGFTNKVQRFSLLPATAPAGYTVEVAGDPNGAEAGNYYVRYDPVGKVWTECVRPAVPVKIEASTMPHELVRQSNGVFAFRRVEWADRVIGDADSNPLPSFINNTINDIAFFRNRLWLISGENVVGSESAEYFNFWMTTASDLLDTDPIDVSTSTARVNILNYAVPFNAELYCFSDKSQFVLRSDTTLSPKNTALVEVTGFNSSPDCRPVRAGRNLYFAASRSEYASIKEYYSVAQTSEEKNAQDITSHIPDYIKNGVYHIDSNTNENIMIVLTRGDPTGIYVYKYLFINEQRVQSSWSRWDMQGRVFSAFFVGSALYLLINRGGTHILEKLNFTTVSSEDITGEPYRVYLDAKKRATSARYNVNTKMTTVDITAEYALQTAAGFSKVGVVSADGHYTEAAVQGGKIQLMGDYATQTAIIGLPYTFRIALSPIYIRQEDKQSTKALLNGRLQVRYIHLNYVDTGGFVVYVKSRNGAGGSYTYRMTARNIGRETATLGQLQSETGIFKIPVQALNTNVDITIESNLPLPLALIGFLWEGSWVQRSRGG